MKTILLTGGTGLYGSHAASKFISSGYRVKFLARSKNGEPAIKRVIRALKFANQNFLWNPHQCSVIEGDVTEPLPRMKGIDEIYHFAALLSFSKKRTEEVWHTNVNGTKNVIDLALKSNIPRMHHVSTAYVFGNKKGTFYENELDCEQKHRNSYERSKFQAEKIIREAMSKISITVCRPGILVGDSHTGRVPSFGAYYTMTGIFYFLKNSRLWFKDNRGFSIIPLRVLCSPSSTVNLIPVDYAVETIFALGTAKETAGKTFHIVNETPPSFQQMFFTTMKILGMKGFQLIDIKNQAPLERNFSSLERMIQKKSEAYFPYICGEPILDCSNVRKILGSSCNLSIPFTEDLFRVLLDYATKQNFGKKGGD